jgi:hypothetical protein
MSINTKTKNMTILKPILSILTLAVIALSLTISSTSLADPIYDDVSTAVNTTNTIINSNKAKLLPNGTDTANISFSLFNAVNEKLTDDLYTVSIKSSNGTLTPLIQDANGLYTSTFKTPTSGTDSKIDVNIIYKYYACEGVEAAIATLDADEEIFYADGGFSIVNSRISQLTRGISDIDMEEIVYDQGQDVAGLENWASDEREAFTDDFYDLLINLKCYKPGESTNLTSRVFSYVEAPVVVTPTPTPTPVPPSTPKIEPAFKPYTTRTGGIKNGFIFVSLLTFGLTFAIIIKNKVTKK